MGGDRRLHSARVGGYRLVGSHPLGPAGYRAKSLVQTLMAAYHRLDVRPEGLTDFSPCDCGAGGDLEQWVTGYYIDTGGTRRTFELHGFAQCMACAIGNHALHYGVPPAWSYDLDTISEMVGLRDDPRSLSYQSWHRN